MLVKGDGGCDKPERAGKASTNGGGCGFTMCVAGRGPQGEHWHTEWMLVFWKHAWHALPSLLLSALSESLGTVRRRCRGGRGIKCTSTQVSISTQVQDLGLFARQQQFLWTGTRCRKPWQAAAGTDKLLELLLQTSHEHTFFNTIAD